MFSRDFFKRMDLFLIAIVSITIVFGIFMIYSAGFDPVLGINKDLYKRQIIWFIIGIIFLVMMSIVNYRLLGDYALYIYGILLFVLLVTTVFGRPIRGHKAWLSFGLFSLQPSEFMKIAVVIVLAKYLELRERDIKNFRELLIPSLITIIPVMIIMKQPDFSTAALFIFLMFIMLFIGGADVSHLISFILIAAIAVVIPMMITYWEWAGYKGTNYLIKFFLNVDALFTIAGIFMFIALASFISNFFI